MTKTLKSGAQLAVSVAPWSDANALRKAVLKTLKGQNPDSELSQFSASIEMLVSDEVEQALIKCFERVIYNGRKLQMVLFDDAAMGEQLRADYYEICSAVIEANIVPFNAAFSGSKALPQTVSNDPK